MELALWVKDRKLVEECVAVPAERECFGMDEE